MGFTDKEYRTYSNLCRLREDGVIKLMRQFLKSNYTEVISTPAYVVAIGNIPVGIVAHADTVFRSPPKEIFYDRQEQVVWSPTGMGADDRAGIFSIMKLVRSNYRPHIIITTGEESGCIGAYKLSTQMRQFPAPLKFLIELDRRGFEDAVFYDCDNKEFESYITNFGFKTKFGTFSDITVLAPSWGVSAVNLSIGYEDEHSSSERLYVDDMMETIAKVQNILDSAQEDSVPVYPYIAAPSTWNMPTTDATSCTFCNSPTDSESLLPITWQSGNTSYELAICVNCYADHCNNIVWCDKCGKGYYMPKMPSNERDWVCDNCKRG